MISSMNVGGAETMVKDYALLMDRSQFNTKIISLDKCSHSANEQVLEKAGIEIIYLSELRYPADARLNILQKIIRKAARYYDLRKIIKEEKPDILHVHLYIGDYLKLIPAKKWGIKLLYTVHNVPERFFDPSGKEKEKYSAFKEVKRLLKDEDLTLVALHKGMEQELRELFATEHVITVNNGINLDRFHKELYNREEIRKNLGIADHTLVVGHIGRFHEQKNHDFIIKVFHEVLNKKNDAKLILIGIGALKEGIIRQVQKLGMADKVIFLENRRDIPELMAAMDVFLFPSRWEGFGNVLIEAQSMEIPCVVSDKIHENVIVNSNVEVLSLETPVSVWADIVIRKNEAQTSDEIQKYDIRNSVKKLEKVYLDKEN